MVAIAMRSNMLSQHADRWARDLRLLCGSAFKRLPEFGVLVPVRWLSFREELGLVSAYAYQ